MIKVLPESDGATIGIEVTSHIDAEQGSCCIEIFDALIKEHNHINVLIVLNGKISMDIDVIYADLKCIFKHLNRMNKFATVSESKMLESLVIADAPFGNLTDFSEKHFELSKQKEAWAWVKS